MIILGIESSCDETAMAILQDGKVLSSVVASQIKTHQKFGGVVPEIAAREHITALLPVLDSALSHAGIRAEDIDAVAVTSGPGLIGALLVGVSSAKAIAHALNKPLYPVHHIVAHITANQLVHEDFELPFIALVVSGGHTHLYAVDEKANLKTLARTRDDAAGESFDKIARAMGLPYPGGPEIDRLARLGDPKAYKFPEIKISDDPLDFSFSGLKTAALNYLNHLRQKNGDQLFATQQEQADFAASFQSAIIDQILDRCETILSQSPIKHFALAGGVAANHELRSRLETLAKRLDKDFFVPPLKYCGDNAAMVASLGYLLAKLDVKPVSATLNPVASWPAETYRDFTHLQKKGQ